MAEVTVDTEQQVETSANVVAHALSQGTATQQVVSPEQAADLCETLTDVKPATEALRKAAAKPRRFVFVAR